MNTSLYIVVALILGCLGGCQNLGMTPEQLRASAGMATCTTVNSLVYGKAAFITANADDVRKGATNKGETIITCGEGSMSIKTDTGVPVPPGATTTTTTTVKPAP